MPHRNAVRIILEFAIEEIHGADEIRNKPRFRLLVQHSRRRDLDNVTMVHHRNAVGKRQCLFLIVRNKYKRNANMLLQQTKLNLHLFPEFFIKRAQGLIKQQHFRLFNQSPGQCNPLSLPAREFIGTAISISGQLDQLQYLFDALCKFLFGQSGLAHAERDILGNVQMREYGIVLENHVDRANVR